MRPLLRTLVGIVVGVGYGVLVGVVLFLIGVITGGSNSNPLMIDPQAMVRLVITLAMTVTGCAGVVVGFIVTLFRPGRVKAALVGFCTGVLVFAGIVFIMWSQLDMSGNAPPFEVSSLILLVLVLIVMFPAGLAATGVTASVLAHKFFPDRKRNPSTALHL